MGSLSNLYISASYTSLVHLGNDGPITSLAPGQFVALQDGLGNNLQIELNNSGDVNIGGILSASNIPTDIATQAELNAYTQSTNIRLNNIETTTASLNISVSNINSFTSSQNTKNTTLSTYTASVNTKFDAVGGSTASLNAFTASNGNTSLNTYTASQDTKNATLAVYTASVNTKFDAVGGSTSSLNAFTASQQLFNASATASILELLNLSSSLSGGFVTEGELAAATGSLINQINTKLNTSSFNAYTQSNDNKVNSLINATSSYAISSSVALVDYNQQQQINSLIAVTASFLTSSTDISSLNAFTASQETKNSTLASVTASLNNSVSLLNSFTQSQTSINTDVANSASLYNTKWNTLGGQTGSYVTSAITASSLVTASVNLNTITFTKGDATTFNINVNTGSATDISSLNQFTASQLNINSGYNTFTSSTNTSINALNQFTASQSTASLVNSITELNTFSASAKISISALNSATSSYVTETESGSFLITASFDNGNRNLTFTKGDNTTFAVNIPDVSGSAGTFVTTSSFNAYTQSNDQRVSSLESNSASVNISISNINQTTASLNSSVTQLNVSSASQQVSIDSLNAATSSYANSASVALVDANQQSQINSLIAATGSYLTASADITSLNAFTASQLNINTGYNTFTSSANQRLGSLETNSASVNTSISALNTFTASQSTASLVTSITNLNTFTSSQLTINSAIGASTASLNTFSSSVLTQLNTLANVTSSLISKTGSYATTGSNNFIGDQTITGNITAFSASFTYLQTIFESSSIIYSSGSNQFGDELTDVQTLSGSVKVQGSLTVNGTPVLTSSVDISGLVTTASFNAYTSSNNQRVSSLETNSASVNISISNINSTTASLNSSVSNLNQFTASQTTASIVSSLDNLNTFSASTLTRLTNIESTTASLNNSITNINSFTQSANQRIGSLEAATSSYVTSAITASSLVTASVNLNTITFTKGDASTFNITVNTGSAITTDLTSLNAFTQSQYVSNSYFATTASLNDYTQSTNIRLNNLESTSASVNISISNLNSTTSSFATSITNLNTATQSLFSSASLGLVTASFSGNTLTFTKGNGTTFGVVIPDVSGSTIPSGTVSGSTQIIQLGFLQTSSFNSYTSSTNSSINQLNDSSASQQISINNLNAATSSFVKLNVANIFTQPQTINYTAGTGSLFTTDRIQTELPSNKESGYKLKNQFGTTVVEMGQDNGGDSSGFIIVTNASNAVTATISKNGFEGRVDTTQFTASLAEGYVFVGDGSGKTSLVATSSFGGGSTPAGTISSSAQITSLGFVSSSITASSLVTASVNLNTITFTKGDTSTFNITVNTGSAVTTDITALNSFTASQETKDTTLASVTSSLNTATASLFTSASLALVTASFSGNTLTFTKGDTSTFGVVIPDVSGSAINTGSFATTGSNTFSGSQTITGSQFITGGVVITGQIQTGPNQLSLETDYAIRVNGKVLTEALELSGSNLEESFNSYYPSTRWQHAGDVLFTNQINTVPPYTNSGSIQIYALNGANLELTGSQLNLSGVDFIPFSASLDSRLTNIQSATASLFTSASRALVTASVSLNTITFTKGDGTTFPITVNTGSGGGSTFSNPSVESISGSLLLTANTFTSGAASIAHLSASAQNQVNLVFKNNNSTGDTIISGSNNIYVNPGAASAAGFKRYFGTGNIALLGSTAQISASMAFSPTLTGNNIQAEFNFRGPVSASDYQINNNFILGNTNFGNSAANNFEKMRGQFVYGQNLNIGTVTVIANKEVISGSTNIIRNVFGQGSTININSSSVTIGTNNLNGVTINNNYFSGSAGNGLATCNNSILNVSTINYEGQNPVGATNQPVISSVLAGNATLHLNPSTAPLVGTATRTSIVNSIMWGNGLIVTGSSIGTATQTLGSAFFGRFNAQNGNRSKTGETVFAVGTGTGTGASLKTGFLIDSGSNSFFEGTLNVSGSTSLTGSLTIQSGSAFFANGNRQFNVGAFSSLVSQSGSANVSQSMNFETTDISNGVSIVSNSQITLANSGTYNIQFSAQLNADTGADTIWIWLKKNGTNVSSTTTKLVLANNEANIAAWNFVVDSAASDYFELAWQNINGHAKLVAEAAAGNYPAIPSIILTVTQVR